MKHSSLVLVIALVSCAILAPPTSAEETTVTTGHWERKPSKFLQRQKAGATAGVMEDDKDKTEDGGTTTFNETNMEVKCIAERADNEVRKSASGRASYAAPYIWIEGTGSNPPPPDQYFRVDLTTGIECHASPIINTSLPIDQQPGEAVGTGKGGGFARNRSLPESELIRETKEIDRLIDTSPTGIVSRSHGIIFDQDASASAFTQVMVEVAQPPIPGMPPPPPPAQHPISKACKAEGRTYGKASAARPYVPAP